MGLGSHMLLLLMPRNCWPSFLPVKVVRGIFGSCLGANNIPHNVGQYKNWIQTWFPGGADEHTLSFAAICWAIWKARNKACFDKKLIKNPLEIVIHACALINFWAGLYSPEVQNQLAAGVKIILSCAHRVLARQVLHPLPRQDDSAAVIEGSQEGEAMTQLGQYNRRLQLRPIEDDASDQEEQQ